MGTDSSSLNVSKNDQPLKDWLAADNIKERIRVADLLIPPGIELAFSNFPMFIDERRDLLKSRLKELVGVVGTS